MKKLIDYKSPEKDILINVFNEYATGSNYEVAIPSKGIHLFDSLNISSIIENLIYEEIEEYHENGSLKCKYTLRFRERHGLYQTWFRNGQINEECYYKDGKREGVMREPYKEPSVPSGSSIP